MRQSVTAASHEIDQRLSADPENEGESRPDDRRIMFVAPLGVMYEIDQDQGIVFVLQVWSF